MILLACKAVLGAATFAGGLYLYGCAFSLSVTPQASVGYAALGAVGTLVGGLVGATAVARLWG